VDGECCVEVPVEGVSLAPPGLWPKAMPVPANSAKAAMDVINRLRIMSLSSFLIALLNNKAKTTSFLAVVVELSRRNDAE